MSALYGDTWPKPCAPSSAVTRTNPISRVEKVSRRLIFMFVPTEIDCGRRKLPEIGARLEGRSSGVVSAPGLELLCRTATTELGRQSMASRFQRNVLTGLLTVVPLWVTWIVFEFVLELLARFGSPAANWLARQFDSGGSAVSSVLLDPWFQWTLAIVITILGLYCLGLAASFVIGRR